MLDAICMAGFFGVAVVSAYNGDYAVAFGSIILAALWFK